MVLHLTCALGGDEDCPFAQDYTVPVSIVRPWLPGSDEDRRLNGSLHETWQAHVRDAHPTMMVAKEGLGTLLSTLRESIKRKYVHQMRTIYQPLDNKRDLEPPE